MFGNNFHSKIFAFTRNPDHGLDCYSFFYPAFYWNRRISEWKAISQKSLQSDNDIYTTSVCYSVSLLCFPARHYRIWDNFAIIRKDCSYICTFVASRVSYGLSVSFHYENGFIFKAIKRGIEPERRKW